MSKIVLNTGSVFAVIAAATVSASGEASPAPPADSFASARTIASNAKGRTTGSDDLLAGRRPPPATPSAPLTLTPEAGNTWDLSRRESLSLTLQNPGTGPARVEIRAENETANGMKDTVRTIAVVPPGGAATTVLLRLMRRPEDPTFAAFKPYVRYYTAINVHDNTLDPAAVARVIVSLDAKTGSGAGSVVLTDLRAVGEGRPGLVPFFPFVDRYGQYAHTDWPGKIHSDAEFATRIREENAEMRAHAGPSDWDKWGGWATGPQLSASGHFTTTKWNGKWWLVDPDGRLFFSYGPTGVGSGGVTPTTGRENWFAWLPPKEGSFSQYRGEGKNAPFMHYKGLSYGTFDFAGANAERKYGTTGKNATLDRLHQRLHNWGFNTLGNWSTQEVAARKKTPYVVAVHYGGPKLFQMPDAFSPEFETTLRDRLAREKGVSAGDPWCIGYFVDNELHWGPASRGENIAESALKSAPGSASKNVLIADLAVKYTTTDRLNAAWCENHLPCFNLRSR